MSMGSRRVVLVPGGMHGSWCFDLLIPELEAVGIDATAVDLPIEDPHAGTEAYVDASVRETPFILIASAHASVIVPLEDE